MLNAIIRLSLQNRPLVIALSILLMGFGGYVATSMPVDVFPDLTAPTVTVITDDDIYSFSTTFAAVPTTRVLIEMPFDEVVHLDRLRGAPTVTAQVDLSGCNAFAAP